jgi:hypothetical protein
MAWETRKGSDGRYYTRSRRRPGGRVAREYIGSGAVAELLAQLDAQQRKERALEAELAAQVQAERAAYYARLFGPLDALEAASSELMRQTLTELGYRQHDRGEWRRPRGNKSSQEAGST